MPASYPPGSSHHRRVGHHLVDHRIVAIEVAINRDLLVELVEPHRHPQTRREFYEIPCDRPLRYLARQRQGELPLALRILRWLDHTVRQRQVHHVRRRIREVRLLVVMSRRQHNVRPQTRRCHLHVHRNDQVELWPEVLQQLLLAAARSPQHVAADLEQHPRRRLRRRVLRPLPPTTIDRFLHVLRE
jgi:hypothetical protein